MCDISDSTILRLLPNIGQLPQSHQKAKMRVFRMITILFSMFMISLHKEHQVNVGLECGGGGACLSLSSPKLISYIW